MFSKYFSASSDNSNSTIHNNETTPMLGSSSRTSASATRNHQPTSSSLLQGENAGKITQVTQVAQEVVQDTVHKIQQLNETSPFSFRVLGLVGGLAMIIWNLIFLPGRILTLHWTSAVISFYCILFGAMIVLLELESSHQATNTLYRQVKEGIRCYVKFLEYTWGRGMLYVFVGSLQAANGDWLVGTFMMLVGTVACAAGVKTAHDLRRFRITINDERDLKRQFKKYDTGNKGHLAVPELRQWILDAGILLSANEIVSAYLALNKHFDDHLSYEEMVDWWGRPSRGNLGLEKYSV